jgi:ABC-type transport system involved in cytochrome bd biosynthesis fused ATPase/permease subunit
VSIGAARRHPVAPPLAAAIVGLCVVGLIDSLFDMPRVTFLVLTLLTTALLLPRVNEAPSDSAAR